MANAVLFDLDETVLDRTASLKNFVQWQVDGMLYGQIDAPSNFVQRFIELDNNGKVWKDQVYRQLIEEYSIQHWAANELLQTYVLCFCSFCVPRADIHMSLEHLRNKAIRMGVVTNGKSPFQERNLRSLSESIYFDSVLVSEALGIRKPDSRIFELACKELNADLHSSIFIGDNPIADIRGAKNVGMKTIYVPKNNDAAPCSDADVTVVDLRNLPKAIDLLLENHK